MSLDSRLETKESKMEYAVADKVAGKDGKQVFISKEAGATFTPRKTWKTTKGAMNFIRSMGEKHTPSIMDTLEVVAV